MLRGFKHEFELDDDFLELFFCCLIFSIKIGCVNEFPNSKRFLVVSFNAKTNFNTILYEKKVLFFWA